MIVAYIWNWRYSHGSAWAGILGLMLLSHVVRRESAYSLGFRTRHMGECWREFGPALAFLSLLLLASGILLHTMRPIETWMAMASWAVYVPWGVFQQYALNGYFLNRFQAVVGRRAASLISAALFCAVHAPNWFLMVVALPAGYCCTLIYQRYRNLYFLGLTHATVGFLLSWWFRIPSATILKLGRAGLGTRRKRFFKKKKKKKKKKKGYRYVRLPRAKGRHDLT